MRVLHIEDEPTILDLVKRMFGLLGHETVGVRCREELEEELKRIKDYQLVLCDYTLIGMNGVEVVEQIRAVSNIYIVANSAMGANNEAMIRAGANDEFLKTWSIIGLNDKLKEIIDSFARIN